MSPFPAPLGFRAGDSNLSRYLRNGPVGAKDPSGLVDTAYVSSITVAPDPDFEESEVGKAGFDDKFRVTFKGLNMDKCFEYTQFITQRTKMWDASGKRLSTQAVYAAFKASGIKTYPGSDPFASSVLDDGWHTNGTWNRFSNSRTEVRYDHQRIFVPFHMKDGEKTYYAFQDRVSCVIKVRDLRTHELELDHYWGYTVRNFNPSKLKGPPTGPSDNQDDWGYYDPYGVTIRGNLLAGYQGRLSFYTRRLARRAVG